MFEDKKRDELEALMAAWVGEVGQLNKAVQDQERLQCAND